MPAVEWYYARGEEAVGPLGEGAFAQAVADGLVAPDTLVWREGMAQWLPYAEATRPAGPRPDADDSAAACGVCGAVLPLEDLLAYEDMRICANCKPAFFLHLQETGQTPGALLLAGFGIRFVAKVLDGLVFGLVVYGGAFLVGALLGNPAYFFDPGTPVDGSLELAIMLVWNLSGFAFPLAYNTWFIGRYGATPGKMAMGIRVVRPDGAKLTYLRALGRHFAEFLTSMTCFIGYLTVLFDKERRTLHDLICDTRVVVNGPRR